MDGQEDVSQYSKEVAKGSFWGLLGQLFFKLISFFYVILIARMASQDDIGLFYLSMGIVTLVAVFSHIGLPGSLARYVPYFEARNEKGKIRHMLKLSYAAMIVVGLFFSIVMWLAADTVGEIYQNPVLPDAIRMFSVFLLLSNIFSVNLYYLQGRADIKAMQFVQNLQNALKLGLTLCFFYLYGATVFTLIAGLLGAHILAIFASLPFIIRKMKDLPETGGDIPKEQLVKEMIPFGLTLTIISSFWIIIQASDKLLLGYLVEPSQATQLVAIYAMATALASALMIFPIGIGSIFLPVMSRLAGKNDLLQMRSVTEAAQRWTLFITVPIGIVVIAFSADILGVFYGVTYQAGALAMSIFLVGIMAKAFSMMLSFALAALRLVKIELEIVSITAGVNIVLNMLLIPPYGMEGAAFASAISLFLMLALLYRYSKKLFGFRLHPAIYKMVAAGVAAFLILLLMQPVASSLISSLPIFGDGELDPYIYKVLYLLYVMILVSISVAFFMAFSLMLKCFRREDIILMKKAMGKARIPAFAIDIAGRVASYGLAD